MIEEGRELQDEDQSGAIMQSTRLGLAERLLVRCKLQSPFCFARFSFGLVNKFKTQIFACSCLNFNL